MTDFHKLDEYMVAHLDASLSELSRLVAQPSVGAQTLGIEACAQLVAELLKARGFQVDIVRTKGGAGGIWEFAGILSCYLARKRALTGQ